MLHHISFGVRDLPRAGRFNDAALGTIAYRRVNYRRVYQDPAGHRVAAVHNQPAA